MSKDLLESLSAVARQEAEAAEDERLESLLRAEISAEELAELEQEAARDSELARRLELYRPLDATTRARIADKILETAPAPLRSAGPSERWRRVVWLMPVAAAAALMLWLMQPARIAPLPDFSPVVEGGDSELRGQVAPPSGPIRLSPSSTLTLVLRPASGVEGPLATRFFALRGDEVERLEIEPERAASGSPRLRATAAELFGARRGSWRLVALVGRPPALEANLTSKIRGTETRGLGWQRISVEVLLVDDR